MDLGGTSPNLTSLGSEKFEYEVYSSSEKCNNLIPSWLRKTELGQKLRIRKTI